MPQIKVDFSNVEEFEALPKGEYDCVIAKAEMRYPSDAEKSPYINLEMDVKDVVSVSGGDAPNLDGTRKLWAILSLSPKALWRTKQVFENLGIYADEMELDVDEETNQVVSPELVGQPVRCAVSTRVYEGRTQNQVDAITSPEGGGSGAKSSRSGPKASGPKRGGRAFK